MDRSPLANVQRANVVIGLAVMIACGGVWGRSGVLAAGLGALFACANFWAIQRLSLAAARRAVNEGPGGGAVNGLLAGLVAKMIGLFILVGVAVRGLGLDGLPFGLGLSVLVMSLLVCSLWAGLREAV